MSNVRADEVLSPGERVDLQLITDSEVAEEDKKYYITKICDIRSEDEVEIMMPMEKTKLQLLPVDTEYQMFFYAKRGIYTCEAKVTKRYREDLLYIVVLELLTPLKKQQRREYYRYSCVIGMNSRQLNEEEAQTYISKRTYELFEEPAGKSVIVDISGGGMRFVSRDVYEKDKLVYGKFRLNVKETVKTYSCVVRVIHSRPVGNHTGNIEYRGEFVYMDESVRESIIRFIFEDERRMRKKM